MAQQDITGLLTGIFAGDPAAQQQKLLSQQAVAQNPNLLASAQTQIGRAPEQLARMRQNVGGMFGQDLRSSGQKVQEQLQGIDVTRPEGQQQAVSLISQIDPARALALQTQFNERNKAELKAAAEFGLEKDKLDYQKESLAAQQGQLKVSDRKAIREATANARANADKANELIGLAKDYETFEPTGGFLGTFKNKWKEFTGTQGGEEIARTRFLSLRSTVTNDKLPPGAASDKDVALALEGWPSAYADPDTLASFMRGQAKLAAILAEREDARAAFMSKDGLDVGFSDKWRESVQEEGFSERIANKYGLEWMPVETVDASTLQGVPDVNTPTQQEIDLGNRVIAAQARQGSRR